MLLNPNQSISLNLMLHYDASIPYIRHHCDVRQLYKLKICIQQYAKQQTRKINECHTINWANLFYLVENLANILINTAYRTL